MNKHSVSITFKEAKTLMDSYPNCTLLDVRTEAEYVTGHADDAILLPVDEITPETAAQLLPDQDAPLLLYCKSGKRSRMAAEILAGYGYTQVYDIGCLIGWPYGLSYGG